MTLRALACIALLLPLQLLAAPVPADQQALHVLNRIAYGPKPGDIERVTAMGVRNYIDSQLDPAALPYPPELNARLDAIGALKRPAGDMLAEFTELRRDVRDEEEGARKRRQQGVGAMSLQTSQARVLRAIDSPRQLEEVMVDFWFNHFNVFFDKGEVRPLVASYERDAIRPYVFGRFRDMLGATAKHPAMLYYLDNYLSSAAPMQQPNKPRPRGGLNENYARELMELHTLGVNSGYSQKDVTELARMLTGWTYDKKALMRDNETFRFDPRRHDRGVKLWLGRQVGDEGQAEGEYALDVLAMHPATARHISYKLAQYFVRDEPPKALVERMARTWLDSSGNLRSVLRTLLTSDEFMASDSVGAKFKTPYQFVISAARASATPVVNITPLLNTMSGLGMPLYGCQTPDGYKNTQEAWLNPDALSRRISFASQLAEGRLPLAVAPAARAETMGGNMMMASAPASAPAPAPAPAAPPVRLDPALLGATLGPAISSRTQGVIAASPENLRAALLLGSPDFMQR